MYTPMAPILLLIVILAVVLICTRGGNTPNHADHRRVPPTVTAQHPISKTQGAASESTQRDEGMGRMCSLVEERVHAKQQEVGTI